MVSVINILVSELISIIPIFELPLSRGWSRPPLAASARRARTTRAGIWRAVDSKGRRERWGAHTRSTTHTRARYDERVHNTQRTYTRTHSAIANPNDLIVRDCDVTCNRYGEQRWVPRKLNIDTPRNQNECKPRPEEGVEA